MNKFTKLRGVAAPLNMINIDTDKLIPKQFLKTIKRTGLGKHLFNEMRFNEDGSEKQDFVLNKSAYREASIIVAGDNFGCGSSREHAPWAILEYGFKAVIAPSYADIFFNNSSKNGLLTVILAESEVDALFALATGDHPVEITIDLQSQTVVGPNGFDTSFDIDPFRKTCLLEGLDEIGLSLKDADAIRAYEAKRAADEPWLFRG